MNKKLNKLRLTDPEEYLNASSVDVCEEFRESIHW